MSILWSLFKFLPKTLVNGQKSKFAETGSLWLSQQKTKKTALFPSRFCSLPGFFHFFNNKMDQMTKTLFLGRAWLFFTGNMRLYPRAARFTHWAHLKKYVNQMEKKRLTQSPRKKRKPSLREQNCFQALQLCKACEKKLSTTQSLDLETSWLSGFMQAEGCFSL